MNPELLDPFLLPECRPVTALGRVLVLLTSAPVEQPVVDDKRSSSHFWTNRAGQHAGETFFLATLISLIISALSFGWLIQQIAPSSFLTWLLTFVGTVPVFIVAIHVLIFAASGIEALLQLFGIQPAQFPGHFCGRLFLALLSAWCVLILVNAGHGVGDRLMSSTAALWLTVVAVNFAAWIFLQFRELRQALT